MPDVAVAGHAAADLPTRAALLRDVARAEQADGWLALCADAGIYVALHGAFVDALAHALRPLVADGAPVLEVCAGRGALACALRARGIAVIASDASPPPDTRDVHALAADAALQRFAPRVVLGSFVPLDAGVERAIDAQPSVTDYVALGARLGEMAGAAWLRGRPSWRARAMPAVTAEMLCRHDVWLSDDLPLLRFGEAWHFRRARHDHAALAAAPGPRA